MTDLEKFQRVCRVLLARLLTVNGPAALEPLRQMADDLERQEQERLNGDL